MIVPSSRCHSDAILGREYDLLIVDEAHKLKNRTTLAWQFVNKLRKRYVLMLTATPVQNDLLELYSLVTILTPGQLGTVRAFRRHFLDQSDVRQPKNSGTLRRLLNDVMIRNRRSKVDITLPSADAPPSTTWISSEPSGCSTPTSPTTSAAASMTSRTQQAPPSHADRRSRRS